MTMEPTHDNRPGPDMDNETDNTDLDYEEMNTSQETVRGVVESDAELTHSTCSDEEPEKKTPKEPPTKPPHEPSTSREYEQHQEPTDTNETTDKTHTRKRSQRNAKKTEKLIALEGERKGKKSETTEPQPKPQNSKDLQKKINKLENSIQKERNRTQKEIETNKNHCKTIKNLEKKIKDMIRSHRTEINSLQIEMDQLKEESQRKLEETETECRKWKEEAKENRKQIENLQRQLQQERTNHTKLITLMDSNGNRMKPYLQERHPEMECRPQYTTTELKDIAETLDDINETDTIAIMTGTNDIRNHTPYQEAAENIQEAIKTIKENHPTTNILLVQPPPIITNDVTITYNIVRLSDSLERIAKEEGIKYVETEDTISQGSTAMEQDGYHLNQTGRQIHAAAILQAIDEIRQENQTQTTQNRQEQNNQETIEIIKTKASLVGHIIGKQGRTKKQIEDQHQIKIKITNQEETEESTIIITGNQQRTKEARQYITQTLQNKETEITSKQQLHQNDHLINCRYYRQGACKFGENCRYNHSRTNPENPQPDHNRSRSRTRNPTPERHNDRSTTPYRNHHHHRNPTPTREDHPQYHRSRTPMRREHPEHRQYRHSRTPERTYRPHYDHREGHRPRSRSPLRENNRHQQHRYEDSYQTRPHWR